MTTHAWDGFLHQLLRTNWQDPWLDMMAINQKKKGEVDLIESCILACAEGVVVYIPGEGPPNVALHPFMRSWCVAQIITVPEHHLAIKVTAQHGDHGGAQSFGACH